MKTKIVIIAALISFLTFFVIFVFADSQVQDKQDTNMQNEIKAQNTGCTSPEENNCTQCLQKSNEGCVILEWTGGEEATAEPWYNKQSVAECTTNAPECAQCLKRDMEDLEYIMSVESFNAEECKNVPNDLIDPCFAPQSTECLCIGYNRLTKACGKQE